MIRVFGTRIPDLSDEGALYSMLPLLTKERKEKIKGFYKNEDKLRSGSAELLLKYGYDLVNQSPDRPLPKIAFEKYEKPYFSDDNALKFNLSHAGPYVVCVLADCEVGIDVELFSEKMDMSIAKDYFTTEEYQFIIEEGASSVSALRRFFYVWTLKESYMKVDGMGFYKPLDSFSVQKKKDTIVVFEKGIQQNVFMRLWDNYEEMALSVCSVDDGDELEKLSVEWVRFENLIY